MAYCKFKGIVTPLESNEYMLGVGYYLRYPWKFFKHISRTIRDKWQRSKYGFAPIDVWNMDWYIGEVLSKMCKVLAAEANGYNDRVFKSMEDYTDWLQLLGYMFEINTYSRFGVESIGALFTKIKLYEIHDNGIAKILYDSVVGIIDDDAPNIEEKQQLITQMAYYQLGEHYYVLWD